MYAERINGNSPLKRISKGFAYVTDDSGNRINTLNQLKEGMDVVMTMKDGKATASINKLEYMDIQGDKS